MATTTTAGPGASSAHPALADDPSYQVQAALRAEWRNRVRRLPPGDREAWLKRSDVQAALGATLCRQRLDELAAQEAAIAQTAAGAGWVAAWKSTGCDLPLFYDDAGRKLPRVRCQWTPAAPARPLGGGGTIQVMATAAVANGRYNVLVRRAPPPPRVRVGYGRAPLTEPIDVPACLADPKQRTTVRRGAVRLVLSRHGVRYGTEHAPGTAAEEEPTAGPPRRRWTPPQAVGLEDLLDGQSVKEACFYPHPGSPSADVINRIGEMGAKPLDGNW